MITSWRAAGSEGTHGLLGGLLEQVCRSVDGGVELDRARADREISVDSIVENGGSVRADRAGQGEHGAVQRTRQPGDADGRLSEGALSIDGPLASQAQVRVAEARFEVDRLDNQLDAGRQLATGESDQTASEATCGA